MPIDKSDLLDDGDKPSLTIRDIFSAEIAAIEAVSSKVADVVEKGKLTIEAVKENQQEEATPVSSISKQPAIDFSRPEFDFKDTTKTILAKNAWLHQESKIASGGYHDQNRYRSKEDMMDESLMMLNTNLKVYDMLPHKNFVGVHPMEHSNQIVYFINNDYPTPVGESTTDDMPVQGSQKVETAAVSVESRKMKGTCMTHELTQDLRAIHGDGMYDEISTMFAQELTQEFNYSMLNKFREVATTTKMTTSGDKVPTPVDVMMAIHECSAEIAKQQSRVHGANWAIVSKEAAAILLKNTDLDTSNKKEGFPQSVIGHMHGITIYLDNMVENNEMFVGYKGDKILDGGLTYFPHTLVADGSMVVDPSTFQPSKAMYARDAWFMPTEVANNIRRVKFKKSKIANYEGGGDQDSGYYYCPYVPQSMFDSFPADELEDIILPYGPEEIMTVASLFGKEKENE